MPLVDIRKLALDGYRFPLEPERVSVVRPQANAANGMTLAPDGSLLVCEQGSWFQPARISRVDPHTGSAVTLVDRGSRWPAQLAQRRRGPPRRDGLVHRPLAMASCSASGPGRSRRTPSTDTTRPAAR